MARNAKPIFKILLVGIALGAALFFSYRCCQEIKEKEVLLKKRKADWEGLRQILEVKIAHFNGRVGMVIKDLNTNWEFSYNKDQRFPSASLAKVPIMLACFQAAQEGKINLKDTLALKASGKVSGSGVIKNMPAGSQFTVERLIGLMISESDNTAANMLIGLLGFNYLNSYFKRIGLKNTNLSRKMMDFESRSNGKENYTTSADMAYVLEKIYRKRLFNPAISKRCLQLLMRQKINDRIPARLPENAVVAHKTGLERNICHDAGIVFAPKGDLLICVLTKNAPSIRIAKRFISKVAQASYQRYR